MPAATFVWPREAEERRIAWSTSKRLVPTAVIETAFPRYEGGVLPLYDIGQIGRGTGIGPAVDRLKAGCSATELCPHGGRHGIRTRKPGF